MSRPHGSHGRSTAAWKRLARLVLEEEQGICWLCGMPGADTVDHVIGLAIAPQLAMVRSNLRAAHGRRHRVEVHGFDCPGNFGRGGWTPVTNTSQEW